MTIGLYAWQSAAQTKYDRRPEPRFDSCRNRSAHDIPARTTSSLSNLSLTIRGPACLSSIMSTEERGEHSVARIARISPRLDLLSPINDLWVKDKTIVITGGAGGLGEGFFKRWAAAGANVIIGDISVDKGSRLVHDVSRQTGNEHLHFFRCDVTDWQSQVQFFQKAVEHSPHRGIDCVVANAGISDKQRSFEEPQGLDKLNPPEPSLQVMDVNCTGVLYTTHLALFWLQKNPGSTKSKPGNKSSELKRDRHLLLISSMAGLFPIPSQVQYTASKHALVGIFRGLRGTTFQHGIRVNMLCPYYIDTPILNTASRILLAGGVLSEIGPVVEAATRFVADPALVGKAVTIGPKGNIKVGEDGQWDIVDAPAGHETKVMELYADDYKEVELSVRRIVKALNHVEQTRGWIGWSVDIIKALRYSITGP